MTEQAKIDFEKTVKTLDLTEAEVKLKKQSLDKFISNGFPSRKLEDWKFSDINQIIQKNIGDLSFYNDYSLSNKIDTSVFVDGLEHNKIVFINGRIEKVDLSYEDENKVELNETLSSENEIKNSNSLIDLNSAFTNKIYKILIKKDYHFKKPLIIYHTTNSKIKYRNINIKLEFK